MTGRNDGQNDGLKSRAETASRRNDGPKRRAATTGRNDGSKRRAETTGRRNDGPSLPGDDGPSPPFEKLGFLKFWPPQGWHSMPQAAGHPGPGIKEIHLNHCTSSQSMKIYAIYQNQWNISENLCKSTKNTNNHNGTDTMPIKTNDDDTKKATGFRHGAILPPSAK